MTASSTVARTHDSATDQPFDGMPDGYVVGPASQRRRDRHDAQRVLWRESRLQRVQICGRRPASDAGVQVRVTTGPDGKRTAGFGGLQSCGSVWACPVCSASILARRQQEVYAALQGWHAKGHRVIAATFTMRHRPDHRLEELWSALGDAWHATTSGRQWKTDQFHHGVPFERVVKSGVRAGEVVTEVRIPTIRAVEVTHGANGWHVHVHALLFVREDLGDGDVALLRDSMFGRWKAALVRAKLPAPTKKHGAEAHLLKGDDLATTWSQYIAKASYAGAAELTRVDHKTAKRGNRTPFAVLADVVSHGDADDLDIWHEYESVSRGRRQIQWSPGLRDFLDVGAEVSDEDIVSEDIGGDLVYVFDGYEGKRLWRYIANSGQRALLLEAAECSDIAAWTWIVAAESRARQAWARQDVARL